MQGNRGDTYSHGDGGSGSKAGKREQRVERSMFLHGCRTGHVRQLLRRSLPCVTCLQHLGPGK